MQAVGRWSYLIGLVVAVVAALAGFANDTLGLVLVILAVLAGLFFADADELGNYAIRYLVLAVVAGSLDVIPAVGPLVTAVAGALLAFFGPAILTMLLVFNYKQAVDWFKG